MLRQEYAVPYSQTKLTVIALHHLFKNNALAQRLLAACEVALVGIQLGLWDAMHLTINAFDRPRSIRVDLGQSLFYSCESAQRAARVVPTVYTEL